MKYIVYFTYDPIEYNETCWKYNHLIHLLTQNVCSQTNKKNSQIHAKRLNFILKIYHTILFIFFFISLNKIKQDAADCNE